MATVRAIFWETIPEEDREQFKIDLENKGAVYMGGLHNIKSDHLRKLAKDLGVKFNKKRLKERQSSYMFKGQ